MILTIISFIVAIATIIHVWKVRPFSTGICVVTSIGLLLLGWIGTIIYWIYILQGEKTSPKKTFNPTKGMEQALQFNGEPVPKPIKLRQDIAASLLVFTDIYWLIRLIAPLCGINLAISHILDSYIVYLPFLIAWGILCSIASNKVSRIASLIIIVFALIMLMPIETSPLTFAIFNIIKPLSLIYAYSLIIRSSNSISNGDKSWINTIIVFVIGGFFYTLFSLLFKDIDMQYSVTNPSSGFILWNIITYLFLAVAEYRMAKCAVFADSNDSEPTSKGVYSPLNKYLAATLISISTVLILMFLVYGNVDAIENIF
ncbi:MAG: hypothetical protein IKK87_07800 [Bacteroidaceae bacterium]|nr:hypothetical protein [Bacteroidaceae bacterium]